MKAPEAVSGNDFSGSRGFPELKDPWLGPWLEFNLLEKQAFHPSRWPAQFPGDILALISPDPRATRFLARGVRPGLSWKASWFWNRENFLWQIALQGGDLAERLFCFACAACALRPIRQSILAADIGEIRSALGPGVAEMAVYALEEAADLVPDSCRVSAFAPGPLTGQLHSAGSRLLSLAMDGWPKDFLGQWECLLPSTAKLHLLAPGENAETPPARAVLESLARFVSPNTPPAS